MNMIVMFAFIFALGIVVDDAIESSKHPQDASKT